MRCLHQGCSRVKALKMAKSLGGSVKNKRRTGEVVVRHPDWNRPVTINNRRKDAPRYLVAKLNRLAERLSRYPDRSRSNPRLPSLRNL